MWCGVVVSAGDVYGDDRLVFGCGLWDRESGIEKTYTRALPNRNCPLYDTSFADMHTLIIHKTAYSILVSETI